MVRSATAAGRLASLLVAMLTLGMAVQLRAASSTQGSLLWEVRFAAGEDPTARVAVSDNRVFVSGKAPAQVGGETGWLVTAYDGPTGTVLWQDSYSGFSGNENKAGTITLGGGQVFAGGFASTSASADDAMIRAYDEQSGALQWQDQFNYGGSFASVNWVATGLGGTVLYAVGQGLEPDLSAVWFVRAYDAKTGLLLWKNVLPGSPASTDLFFNDPVFAVVEKGRLFVSGFTFDYADQLRHFTVRAYDGGDGRLLWQDKEPGGLPGLFGTDVAEQVVAEGDRVLAAGIITDSAGYHFAVRAYDAQTGKLVWNDLLNTGNGLDSAYSIALNQGRAFVAGTGGAACSFTSSSNCDWLIRAYNQETGALLWNVEMDRNHFDDGVNVVLACGDRVVVTGYVETNAAAPFSDWLVQVLNAADGTFVWEDLLPTPGTFAQPIGLGVSGNRLFVTGSTSDIAGGTQDGDYIVRAYQFDPGQQGCQIVSNNFTF